MARANRRNLSRRRAGNTIQQLPWRSITNPYKPLEILSEDQVEAIHSASQQILEEMGIEVMSDQALDLLAAAGAEVDRADNVVRFDRALIKELIGKAPSQVTVTPRNSDRRITLSGNNVNFSTVGGPPNVHDTEGGRRDGNYEDYCNLLRLAQCLNVVHIIGNQPVAPVDLPAESRHLDCYLANVTLTDRVFQGSSIGAERALDGMDVAAIARGLKREDLINSPAMLSNININSPRRLDGAMADGLIALARWGQVTIVTPFTLMGAMTPVTLPTALAQQNAEALAGIALTQIVRPGAPVMYGAFTSNVDMKSGAPAFGTPENTKATLAGGQFARRYGLPYRSSNASTSNVVDAQAAYESQMSIWAAVMGHASLVYHAAGWMEGGLTASYEKMILDAEMLQMMCEVLAPIEVNGDTLGLDEIREVDPGGHFFGAAHTLERYETAFYQPMLADWRNFETWEEAGAQTATQRASAIWKTLLKDYEQPPLDPAIAEALEAFVAKRKEEIARRAT